MVTPLRPHHQDAVILVRLLILALVPLLAVAGGLFALVGCFRLSGDTAAWQREIVKPALGDHRRLVEFNFGPWTMAAAQTGLSLGKAPSEVQRLAEVCRSLQGGIYRLEPWNRSRNVPGLLQETDAFMRKRRHAPLVRICRNRETVAVYASEPKDGDSDFEIFVVVLKDDHAVVATGWIRLDEAAAWLMEQIEAKAPRQNAQMKSSAGVAAKSVSLTRSPPDPHPPGRPGAIGLNNNCMSHRPFWDSDAGKT